MCLFLCHESQRAPASNVSPLPLCPPTPNIDVRIAHADSNVDNCNTDIHLSDRLWLFRGYVRRSFITLFIVHTEVNVLLAWWTRTSKEVVAPSRMPSGCPSCTCPTSNTPRRKVPLYVSILVGSCATNRKG